MADEVATTAKRQGAWNTRPSLIATFEMASQAADAFEEPADRATAFARIGRLHFRAGDESGATKYLSLGLTAARNIADEGTRALALAEIAGAQAASGNRDAGLTTVAEAVACLPAKAQDRARASALGAIAKAQAAAGVMGDALEAADRIADEFDRQIVLGDIAWLWIAEGRFAEALSAARAMAWFDRRAACLGSIAGMQGRTGDSAGAARSIGEALEVAGRISAMRSAG